MRKAGRGISVLDLTLLACGHQPQVTLLNYGTFQSRDRTEHRQCGITLNRCPQLAFLTWSRYPVEYHTGDSDSRVESRVAGQQRGNSTGYARDINNKHDRQVKLFRQRRITVTTFNVQPIVQAFVAFHEGNVSAA